MTINDLLEYWAEWCARREDNGLGYSSSRFNTLMAGGQLPAKSGFSVNLPYGLDSDGIAAAVDREFCRLTARQKQVVFLEYRRIGSQEAKAAGMARPISRSTFREHLAAALRRLEMSPSLSPLLRRSA